MGLYNNIDKGIISIASQVMADKNYSPANRHYPELVGLLGKMLQFDPQKLILSHNISLTMDIINKFFFPEDTFCLIPPNLGKEVIDSAVRSFPHAWNFFDIKYNKEKNVFSYNENEIKTKIKNAKQKNKILYMGSFFGVQAELSEDLISFLGENDVFIVNYMKDSEGKTKGHFGNISLYHFNRYSEFLTNDVVVIANNTQMDLLPLFANGFTQRGDIVCAGYDMLPTPESQVMLIGKLRQEKNISQMIALQLKIFNQMLVERKMKINFINSIGMLPILTDKKINKRIPNTIVPFTPEIYKHYDIQFPINYIKTFSKIIIFPFGCAITIKAMEETIKSIKEIQNND